MENANKKGSFKGLLPLVIFLAVYFAMGIGTGDFSNFPLMIGIFLASAISLFMKSPVAEEKSFTEKVVMFCKGGGDDTLILMVIIYMLAGAFYGVASGMHATDTVTNIGISILPSHWDFKRNEPNERCPNRDEIKLLIEQRLYEIQKTILSNRIDGKDYTATTIIKSTTTHGNSKMTVGE